VPPGSTELFFEPDGGLLAFAPAGLYRLITTAESAEFARVGPEPQMVVKPPGAVAMHPTNGEIAILSGKTLMLLARGADGAYQVRQQQDLVDDKPAEEQEEEGQSAVMAYAGTTILIAREDGLLSVIRAKDLKVIKTLEPERSSPARFVEAAPNGTWFALVYHNGRLHLYDAKEQELTRRRFAGQGDISAAAFSDNRTLLVADRTIRVMSYDVVANKRLKRWAPPMTFFEGTFRYFMVPLYTIYPKPGELGRTVFYLLSEKETLAGVGTDVREARDQLKPWAPVWSSALFMVVVLAIACIYLWRTDL
jgi:hypothetical protein